MLHHVVITCRLTEPQTVCVLDTMLSSRVKDSVAAYVKCEIPNLTFEKVATTLQYLFVPLDLTKIERITFGSNKSQSESMFDYAGKIRKSLTLCARRLPEESRDSYVEQHMRRLIFNSLNPPLKSNHANPYSRHTVSKNYWNCVSKIHQMMIFWTNINLFTT